jgi:imidazoleglycerol phosphate synthase glutamine amidotransferase subunit HisH
MKTIALFVAQPYCSTQSCNGIIQALSPKYNFKLFTKHEVEDGFFEDVDAVCFPGGFGDSDSYNHLFTSNGDSIRNFVRNGGVYIGICMGGYWAGSCYLDLLLGCDTVQYIKRTGTDTRRPHAKDLDVDWNGRRERMFFYDGFAVEGNETNFRTYAKYMNGDPMAIIQNNIGIIGCHPEATKHWYDSYSWLKGKYISKHNLLLEFIDEVMK